MRVYADIPIGLHRLLVTYLESETIGAFIVRLLTHFVKSKLGLTEIPDPEVRVVTPRPEARGRRINSVGPRISTNLPDRPDRALLARAPKTKIDNSDLRSLFRAHVDAGATIAEIADRFEISTTTVIAYKRTLGYEVREFSRRRA